MKHYLSLVLLFSALVALLCCCDGKPPARKDKEAKQEKSYEPADYGKHPVVEFKTSQGSFKVVLDGEKAPQTVETILTYCLNGFYVGTIFHRIMPDFVAQGGGWAKGPAGNYIKKNPPLPGITDESRNGLKHERGVLSMAKAAGQLAKNQFFIVYKRTPVTRNLDGGYTVFGKVIEGMEVIDSWAKLPKGAYKHGALSDCPAEPPVIKEVIVTKG